jgi:hypothetical protein
MNLYEAKKILTKNGFKLLKESVVTVPCVLDKKLVAFTVYGRSYYAQNVHATSKMTIGGDDLTVISKDDLEFTADGYTDCDGNPMEADSDFRYALRDALLFDEIPSWKPAE